MKRLVGTVLATKRRAIREARAKTLVIVETIDHLAKVETIAEPRAVILHDQHLLLIYRVKITQSS